MDPTSAYIAVAVDLAFMRVGDERRFGEASGATQKELCK
jgi:hypothetical protein